MSPADPGPGISANAPSDVTAGAPGAQPAIVPVAADQVEPATMFDPDLTYFADGTRVVMSRVGGTRAGVTFGRKPATPYDLQAVRLDNGEEAMVAPHVLRREGDGPHVHRFESTGWAYDATQTHEEIHDGDVLVIERERVVGFLMQAWPCAITTERGELHGLTVPAREVEEGRYAQAAVAAETIARELGFELDTTAVPAPNPVALARALDPRPGSDPPHSPPAEPSAQPATSPSPAAGRSAPRPQPPDHSAVPAPRSRHR